jgi:hypothetical protein
LTLEGFFLEEIVTMTRVSAALPIALAALAAVAATPATAQLAGTYSGTSADGNSVNFVVSTDPGTGVLAVTSGSNFFSALCAKDGSILNSGWGYGLTQDIVNRQVSAVLANPYFTISFKLRFAANGQSATGSISTISPTLTPVGPAPKKALYCKSPMQALTVTLQPPAARVTPPAPGTAVMLGKNPAG